MGHDEERDGAELRSGFGEKLCALALAISGNVTELVDWTHTGALAQAKTPCLSQGGSFSSWICPANNKTNAETGIAQALFNGQRMEKWETSSQINFPTQFGQRHQIYRMVEGKGRELERGRNIHD